MSWQSTAQCGAGSRSQPLKKGGEGAKAAISNENRCPFNSKRSVAWQEQLSRVFEGRGRERKMGNETGPGQPLILFPLRTYRVYIG